MSEENEDLDQNPFLVAMRSRAPDLYKLAADQQLVICCPRKAATGALPLNRTCFETHILRESPFFAGVFECLNSEKAVDLTDGVIETHKGFRERRKIKILHEDLHYNGDYKPFRVLCISQALEGGKIVEERRRNAKEADATHGSTLEKCRHILHSLDVKDYSPLSQKAASAVRDFFQTYRIFPKGYLHVVSGKLNDLLDGAAEQLIAANRSSLHEYQSGGTKWPLFRRVAATILLQDTRVEAGAGGGGARETGGESCSSSRECTNVTAHEKLFERVREAYRQGADADSK